MAKIMVCLYSSTHLGGTLTVKGYFVDLVQYTSTKWAFKRDMYRYNPKTVLDVRFKC